MAPPVSIKIANIESQSFLNNLSGNIGKYRLEIKDKSKIKDQSNDGNISISELEDWLIKHAENLQQYRGDIKGLADVAMKDLLINPDYH